MPVQSPIRAGGKGPADPASARLNFQNHNSQSQLICRQHVATYILRYYIY